MSEDNNVVFESVDDILAVNDTRYVTVSAWGGLVRLASLDAGTVLDFVETNKGAANKTANLRLILASLVNSKGERIGSDKHLQAFRNRDSKTILDLVEAILVLNGMKQSKEEREAERAALKNASSAALIGGSPTA